MTDRTTVNHVRSAFREYVQAAAHLGYNTTYWNMRTYTSPVLVTATRGPKGPDSVEPCPGLPVDIGTTYRDAYNAIQTATRTMHSLLNDRPQTHARGLYRYEVHGRYGTHYIDLMYDIKRDGSYIECVDTSIADGSKRKMQSLAGRLNSALHTDPTKPMHSDHGTYTYAAR